MFKFSALSQIWKKYILKLNAWDLSLICVWSAYVKLHDHTCSLTTKFQQAY